MQFSCIFVIMESNIELIERIKTLMSDSGESANAFAKKVDIDPGNFRKKLKGEYGITPKDIYKISKKLGVSREWLESGKGNIFVGSAYSIGGDINIGSKIEKSVKEAMDAPNSSPLSVVSKMIATDENALERENRLLREQLAKKDDLIKRLMDLLAGKL